MTKQAPSSSFVTYDWTYHVFLSFRGMDTRFHFTNNLHQALVRKGICSFIDHEELQMGEELSPTLEKAIEGSRIVIIVFSENYASSAFCLDELVHIIKFIKEKYRLVWPIFYNVNPCNVRYQTNSYKAALDNHAKRFGNNSYKIKKWKDALYKATNLMGEHFTGNEYEHDFIERIVEQISRKINRQPLHISATNLVGLESRVQKVISLLYGEYDEVKCIVGICGIGGIGKSTIAHVVFNLIADQFEGVCFLANVRENSAGNKGLVKLQQAILYEILEDENINFSDVHRGSQIIKDRLQQKKVLLVLDDIDKLKQLRTLVGGLDWFGQGSKIIITTRDKHWLRVHGVERIYEVEGLNDAEAYKLFCWNAFKKNKADSSHTNITMRAIHYSKGLPLALDIIGCNLFGKQIEECESALDAYERSQNKEILEILRVSYDGMEENEKVIFLDLACFFRGYKLNDVKDILLNGRGFNPEYAISVLVEKSLINIDPKRDILSIHDLIQDMGREIVRQESKLNPGEWSRLWCYEDIIDVLQENKGTDKTEFIMLDLPGDEKLEWDGEAFKDMKNLRVLIIKYASFSNEPKHLPNSLRVLDWKDYPSSCLPQEFHVRKLVTLNLTNSLFVLDKPLQNFKSLTVMDLSNNRFLRQVPDMSGVPNLRRLNLKGCINLIEVHDSIGHHERIRELYAAGCSKLRTFPQFIKSTCLNDLDFSGCLTLSSFPKFAANDQTVVTVDGTLSQSSLFLYDSQDFAASLNCGISMFSKLDRLDSIVSGSGRGSSKVTLLKVRDCNRIDEVLSTKFTWFPTLEELILHDNKLTDEFLFTRLPWFPNLTELILTTNNFTTLPPCINQCCFLRTLVLDKCNKLGEIRGIPSSVKHLSAMNCTSLTWQSLSLLSSEKLHEGGGTDFIFPGSRIPNWFHYCCRGSSLSFWFQGKFPLIALCLVLFSDVDRCELFQMQVLVNRHEIKSQYCCYDLDKFVSHIHLFDLCDRFHNLWSDDVAATKYIKDGWNHVEIELEGDAPKVEWIGIYVYKDKQNPVTENVRFTRPTIGGLKRKKEFLDRVQNDGANTLRVYTRRNKKSKQVSINN